MKRNEILKVLIGTLIAFLSLEGCKKDESRSEPSTSPLISTINVSDIKVSSATCGGTISKDGGEPIIARGICWRTQALPTIADNTTNDGTGVGSFTSEITNLTPKTTYYVRAYATNSIGTSYGSEVSFTTIDFPKANVSNIRVISNSSILCNYESVSNGGGVISEYGICWGTNTNPTKESNHIVVPSNGSWSNINLPNLSNNTTYYIRGYAVNEGGIGYGDELTFTTYDWEVGSVTDIDNNTYKTIKIGTQIWMQENLKVTHFRNGDPITNITDNTSWSSLTSSAMCWYDNDESKYKNTYGALYNWYAVVDARNLCPLGWHVPSSTEMSSLLNLYGGKDLAGSKLAVYGIGFGGHLNTNISGFTSLPGGFRDYEKFSRLETLGGYWTSHDYSSNQGINFEVNINFDYVNTYTTHKYWGESIRCVKD